MGLYGTPPHKLYYVQDSDSTFQQNWVNIKIPCIYKINKMKIFNSNAQVRQNGK
jgi:hypothetical protein